MKGDGTSVLMPITRLAVMGLMNSRRLWVIPMEAVKRAKFWAVGWGCDILV